MFFKYNTFLNLVLVIFFSSSLFADALDDLFYTLPDGMPVFLSKQAINDATSNDIRMLLGTYEISLAAKYYPREFTSRFYRELDWKKAGQELIESSSIDTEHKEQLDNIPRLL